MSAGLYFEVQRAEWRGGDALALGDRNTGDPDDFLAVGNDGQGVTEMSRDVGVDQDVLEALGVLHPEWPHPVAGPAGGGAQGEPGGGARGGARPRRGAQ